MKSLEELAAIRNKMQNVVNLRSEASDCTRIVVGMATCGIAAGARPVLKAFSDGIQEKGIKDVMVIQEAVSVFASMSLLLKSSHPARKR